jgi:chromosome segregation ATPase
METDALARLKSKLDTMRRERDLLNGDVLQDRAEVSAKEAQLAKLQAEYQRVRLDLQEREDMLTRLNATIRETENAFSKLLTSTDKLLSALEQESASIAKRKRV